MIVHNKNVIWISEVFVPKSSPMNTYDILFKVEQNNFGQTFWKLQLLKARRSHLIFFVITNSTKNFWQSFCFEFYEILQNNCFNQACSLTFKNFGYVIERNGHKFPQFEIHKCHCIPIPKIMILKFVDANLNGFSLLYPLEPFNK